MNGNRVTFNGTHYLRGLLARRLRGRARGAHYRAPRGRPFGRGDVVSAAAIRHGAVSAKMLILLAFSLLSLACGGPAFEVAADSGPDAAPDAPQTVLGTRAAPEPDAGGPAEAASRPQDALTRLPPGDALPPPPSDASAGQQDAPAWVLDAAPAQSCAEGQACPTDQTCGDNGRVGLCGGACRVQIDPSLPYQACAEAGLPATYAAGPDCTGTPWVGGGSNGAPARFLTSLTGCRQAPKVVSGIALTFLCCP